ncbi:MAG: ribosome maturation factor RimM [Saprospiraceae bacterium]
MNYVLVARIGKTHGLLGELKINIADDFIDDLLESESMLVHSNGQYIPHFVEYIRGDGLLKLEEIDDKESATLLQHKDVYLPATAIKSKTKLPEKVPYLDWVGYVIFDKELGEIGVIEEVYDMPQHYLAEVTLAGKTVLIPLHKDLIISTDDDNRKVEMDLPDGLLDL